MENFKKALKQAIIDKAEAVRFEEGQHPSVMLFSNEKPLPQLNVSSEAEVKALIEGLIAAGVPINDNAKEGVLSIVNFGELKLLAQMNGPARLFAFIPPQGNALYQQIRNQMLLPAKGAVGAKPPINLPTDPADGNGKFAMNNLTEYQRPPQESIPPTMDFAVLPESAPFMKRIDSHTQVAGVPPKPEFSAIPSEVSLQAVREMPAGARLPEEGTSADNDDFRYQKKPPAPAMNTSVANPAAMPTSPPQNLYVPSHQAATDAAHAQASAPELAPIFPVPSKPVVAAAAPAAAASHAHAHAPNSHAANSHSTPDPTIHFGAYIPGESIERNGALPVDKVLHEMVKKRASDIHLTMGEPMCFRIDGDIVRVGTEPMTEAQMREWLLPIMPPKNREEFAKISDTDFAYEVPGLARFRVNIFRDRMGVGCVMRQIPDKVLSADDLGLNAAVRKFCELHKGLVVVTGPTGSGKSTTLAGMVDLINETRTDHILTIEDPIEFVHKQKRCLLNQREVHKHTGSFARALRAALREDPDIILIGEMRDLETVAIAIETAETGHLVFGTLHTNTAISTVDRLIDQFPADQQEQIRVMLAESLKGVVAQTLVKKKGGGRCAAMEILVVDKAVSSLIREGNTHMVQNHMQTQKAKGNVTLNDSLMTLVQKGLVDPKDAYAKAIEKEAFAAMLQKAGITFEGLKTAS